MKMNLQFDGKAIRGVTREEAEEIGVPAAVINEAEVEIAARARQGALRKAIAENAGDTESLLGTTSDAAALAIYGLASLVAKLSTAQSLAEVRAAAEPFAAMSAEFLTKVEGQEVKLPFLLKGVDGVIEEIESRATAVSEVLIAAQE